MSLWFWHDSPLVIEHGLILQDCPECPCAEKPLTLIQCNDPGANPGCTLSRCYEIVAAGFSDDVGNCSILNGTFIVDSFLAGTDDVNCTSRTQGHCCFRGPAMNFESSNGSLCTVNDFWWEMWLTNANSHWHAQIATPSFNMDSIDYILPIADFSCLGNNTFNLSAGVGNCCATYPSTIQVNAVPCPE